MRVFTPGDVDEPSGSKYLGVLVAARYTRELNALPREAVLTRHTKKLTTRALEALSSGDIEFRLVNRRRQSSV
jgi:DNA-directed RNA polymerase subunit K/omega